jgi:hypothetical protein
VFFLDFFLYRTNQNAILAELDSWMPDSRSFGVVGKMRQTSARKMKCPNKSASGNHLGQNDPHPPEVDDRSPCGEFRRVGKMLPNEANRTGVPRQNSDRH